MAVALASTDTVAQAALIAGIRDFARIDIEMDAETEPTDEYVDAYQDAVIALVRTASPIAFADALAAAALKEPDPARRRRFLLHHYVSQVIEHRAEFLLAEAAR